MTRNKKLQQQVEKLLQEDDNDSICILTSTKITELFELFINHNKERTQESITATKEITKELKKGFQNICSAIKESSTTQADTNIQVVEKIETLTNTIKETNTVQIESNATLLQNIESLTKSVTVNNDTITRMENTPNIPLPDLMTNNPLHFSSLNERNKKYHQAFRAQNIIEYYKSIITQEPPFIPPKFRPKVYNNTPNDIKEIKRQHAVENVKREITVLEHNLKEFQNKVKEIDNKNLTLASSFTNDKDKIETIKANYISKRENEEEAIRTDWLWHFDKMKLTHQREMEQDKDCTLKIINENQNFRQPRFNQYNHRRKKHINYRK